MSPHMNAYIHTCIRLRLQAVEALQRIVYCRFCCYFIVSIVVINVRNSILLLLYALIAME